MSDENADGQSLFLSLENLRICIRPARERRLTYLWIASPGPASLKAGTKGRAKFNPATRILLSSVGSVALSALPFVLGKPVKIGESGTREPFGRALTGLQPPLQ